MAVAVPVVEVRVGEALPPSVAAVAVQADGVQAVAVQAAAAMGGGRNAQASTRIGRLRFGGFPA